MRAITLLACFLFSFLKLHCLHGFVAFPLYQQRNSHVYSSGDDEVPDPIPTKDAVERVAVAGATGQTGKLVVEELLDRGVPVTALVRSTEKASTTFSDVKSDSMFEAVQCDLTNEEAVRKAVDDCDAVIWCATGFSSDAEPTIKEKLKSLFGMAVPEKPKQSIDAIGIPILARCMLDQVVGQQKSFPKVVMLSSAGATRPSWDEAKKEKYRGCADIPIVRLNPFGILDVKAESEEKLRQAGVNYCVVRPTGLNDDWPSGARPVFSQGDVAVGRINRKDVANILVDVLSASEACDKTFEVLALAGYPPARNIAPALNRLKKDTEKLSDAELEANFAIMQQLLPGERQDSAALAMGQTYEQLDKGQEGRLGERGQENAEAAAPRPTSA